ncbi:MAG: trifunctional dihydropteroate synthetase [Trichoglossum hirsutum]|nr:MAG: trifunctional dihydropteroate synthetase [Trichoglossum hirsutum]
MDTVFVRGVAIRAVVGRDCWHRDKAQQVSMSLRIRTSIQRAGETDNIEDALDYRHIYKAATALDSRRFPGLISFTEEICNSTLEACGGRSIEATVRLPRALLQADGVTLEASMDKSQDNSTKLTVKSKTLHVTELRIPCIIGVGAHERVEKQPLVVNLKMSGEIVDKNDADYQLLFGKIFERFEKSDFLTLEAFATALAKFVIFELEFVEVMVNARKSRVFDAAEGPGVEITRSRSSFQME